MSVLAITSIFFVYIFVIAFAAVAIAARVLQMREVTGDVALLKDESPSSISPLATILEKLDVVDRLERILDQANVAWSPGRLVSFMMLAGVIALVFFGGMAPGGLAVLIAVGVGALPLAYVLHLRKRRFARFEADFPDAMDSLCRALRAGHPFAAGMEMIASEGSGPIAGEMRKTIEEWKLGAAWEDALANLTDRMPLQDVSIFAAAVRLQMRTGGRLGEALGRLSESMRENSAIRGEVKALAAHGRATGTVLTVLPIGIALMMFTVNPGQLVVLINHPLGSTFIGIAVALLVIAHFVIRKIVDIRL